MSVAAGLLEFGANVIITASRQQRVDTQLAVLRSQVPNIKDTALAGFVCDLASSTSAEANITKLADQVKTRLSTNLAGRPLNHFIYTAADALPAVAFEDINQDQFVASLQVRVTSCILAIQAFLPLIPKTNGSSITLTTGAICEKPISGGWTVTAFIGAGLNGLTRQMASDLAPLRVNIVSPGVVDTDLWAGMSAEARNAFYEGLGSQLPTGKVGNPDDVAESYLYLLRDANVTGSTIHTNGGFFLR